MKAKDYNYIILFRTNTTFHHSQYYCLCSLKAEQLCCFFVLNSNYKIFVQLCISFILDANVYNDLKHFWELFPKWPFLIQKKIQLRKKIACAMKSPAFSSFHPFFSNSLARYQGICTFDLCFVPCPSFFETMSVNAKDVLVLNCL